MKPTIVLVHGAYAESSSWDDVVAPLQEAGHRVIAWATPLRGLASDAAGLTDLVRSIEGPVVLVGHSYGGALLTNVAADAGDVQALVYVAGFALDPGESCADASALVPGGTLGETLVLVPLTGGGADTYIDPAKYHHQFAEDLPEAQAALMAVTQRPVTQAALGEPSGDAPLWRTVPSWFVFGELDRNIPAGAHRIMAERAGSRRTVEIAGASHVVGMSHVAETVQMILEAADASTTAAV
ncbi:Pimeloyl-ACP methyl ester carboxylesterase [Geodermatophilus obscurus]|uniref:Pimeloyl-ACP methyl ester carboxylesterase n=1 Tax=Geodermatophilus obscurus TaxID=1861 RepID=A0A1I5CHG0_9ACTN|nr:alpha/beta hydrolase [Geodermatophilus obscurus]SFN86465.1 Pimeloyl-ACP methyl ester carboxylesterase [Geodermatophilus obscurus]